MSYLRNGTRCFTKAERSKQAERRAYDLSYSPLDIYRKADREFKLTEKNIGAQIEFILRTYTLSDVKDQIRWIQCDIAQRRFEMFSTLQFQHDHVWREGVSASGDYRGRQSWLYYHEAQLKFWLRCAQRLGIAVSA